MMDLVEIEPERQFEVMWELMERMRESNVVEI
jgi:hypothetical protein